MLKIFLSMGISLLLLFQLGKYIDSIFATSTPVSDKDLETPEMDDFLFKNIIYTDSIKEEDKPLTPLPQDYTGSFRMRPSVSEYNWMGLPLNRTHLHSYEWKGDHIDMMEELSPIEKKEMKARFKTWKKIHISEFIEYMKGAFQEEKKIYPKLNVAVCVAQSILESRFNTSKLSVESNNLFGHKYRGQAEGYVVAKDDGPKDRFTKFKSEWWSIRAHSKLLSTKYGSRIKGRATVNKWCKALCGGETLAQSRRFVDRGGKTYATACYKNSKGGSECYGDKIKRIIKYYNL